MPVSPEEFFWLVADIVLAPVDAALQQSAPVLSNARWVDDILISTNARDADQVIGLLGATLQEHGFELNAKKTRILTSSRHYEEIFLHAEHRVLNDLFLTHTGGLLSEQQQQAFLKLVDGSSALSTEDTRLWKRRQERASRQRWQQQKAFGVERSQTATCR